MTDGETPIGPSDIDASWLTTALRTGGAADGTVVDFAVEPVGVGIGLVGSLARVTLTWTDGSGPASVVAKFPTPDEGGRFVARVLGMYRNEVGFYNDLSARAHIGRPECFYARYVAESDDFVLLLGDLGAGRTIDQLSGASSDDLAVAVDHLADLHAGFWADGALLDVDWLRSLDEPPFPDAIVMSFAPGWERVQDLFGGDITPAVRRFGDSYAEVLPDIVARLSAPPWTLSHGDYRADNFVYMPDGEFTVYDWQLVDRSRGARDLAYLLSQSAVPDLRSRLDRAMVERYTARLAAAGVSDYPVETAWSDYRLATAFALAYPVVAGGDINHDDERAVALTRTMLVRCVRAIEDLDALDVV